MSNTTENWPALSFLEGLRPTPDERIELALIASYSADIGSIGAALLALAGRDTDAGGGSPSEFADAVERLRGKVRIVIQRGRLAKSPRTPRIAGVLDQFVREVGFDEAIHSWHPKAALVKACAADGRTRWRLWLGSRNLTESVNRDIGLLLVSTEKGGASIPGVESLVRDLAKRSQLKGQRPTALADAIAKVAWQAPRGVHVERICWSPGIGGEVPPAPPEGVDEIIVVSPFIDKSFLAMQAATRVKHGSRTLLTTMREIERVGPALSVFDELLALDAPDYPSGDAEAAHQNVPVNDKGHEDNEEEAVGTGLHAKLLFFRTGKERRMWVGSANATMRAWTGRNAEVMAQLRVTEPIEDGLRALLGSARCAAAPDVEHLPDTVELEDAVLERARAQVAARWSTRLRIEGQRTWLTCQSDLEASDPHPDEPGVVLEVGLLHGELVIWPRGQRVVDLGPSALADQSDFVRLRVSLCGGRGLAWIQRAPADPPLGEDRDRAAFVRFLGARGFLLWVSGLLLDGRDQAGGDWTGDEQSGSIVSAATPALDPSFPTLEEILAAWARDPNAFSEIERRVSNYLPAVLEQAKTEEPATAELLKGFEDLWSKIRRGLDVDKAAGRP